MDKILYTGFKGKNNSSHKFVEGLKGEKLFLTNSFTGLKKDIENIDKHYDVVYMFGLDTTLKDNMRIEKCAEVNNKMLHTVINLSSITKRLDKQLIKYSISEQPAHFLCNEAYYYMLLKMNCKSVFIHIPPLKYLSEDFFKKLSDVFDI